MHNLLPSICVSSILQWSLWAVMGFYELWKIILNKQCWPSISWPIIIPKPCPQRDFLLFWPALQYLSGHDGEILDIQKPTVNWGQRTVECTRFSCNRLLINGKVRYRAPKPNQPWCPLLHLEPPTPRSWNHQLVRRMRFPPMHAHRMSTSSDPIRQVLMER